MGVVLALGDVGKYLFSINIASFLSYLTSASETSAWDDVIATLLILIANLILWVPIKREIH